MDEKKFQHYLNESRRYLFLAVRMLYEYNTKDGCQFDYTTNPNIYDIDYCYEKAKRIHDIYYQLTKKEK